MLFSRRFLPLFACQFFSAFNDNFLKTSLVFLILFGATEDRSALITLAQRDFHCAVFLPVGARRRNRRSVRQGAWSRSG